MAFCNKNCILENGFNPIWNELCEFHIKNPDFAMLRFEVQDEDMFGERNFIGQSVFPVSKYENTNNSDCSRCILFVD